MTRDVYFRSDIAHILLSLFISRFGRTITRQSELDPPDEAYLRALVAVGVAVGLKPEDWIQLAADEPKH